MRFSLFFICFLAALLSSCQFTHSSSAGTSRAVGQHLLLKEHVLDGKSVSFNLHFVVDGHEISHNEWIDIMASKGNKYTLEVVREFAKVIQEEKLHKCGFSLMADPKSSPFFWKISGVQDGSCAGGITPGQTYDAHNSYRDIVFGREHADNRNDSAYAIAFNSSSMVAGSGIRRLVIPRGPYVTLLDFAQKAKKVEVQDFFQLVKNEVNNRFINDGKDFFYEVHTGSNYAQAVPHFHLRVYER